MKTLVESQYQERERDLQACLIHSLKPQERLEQPSHWSQSSPLPHVFVKAREFLESLSQPQGLGCSCTHRLNVTSSEPFSNARDAITPGQLHV